MIDWVLLDTLLNWRPPTSAADAVDVAPQATRDDRQCAEAGWPVLLVDWEGS